MQIIQEGRAAQRGAAWLADALTTDREREKSSDRLGTVQRCAADLADIGDPV